MKFGCEQFDVHIVLMPTKPGRREYHVREETEVYNDYDHDNEYFEK